MAGKLAFAAFLETSYDRIEVFGIQHPGLAESAGRLISDDTGRTLRRARV